LDRSKNGLLARRTPPAGAGVLGANARRIFVIDKETKVDIRRHLQEAKVGGERSAKV
jgi:hypothetical protein